MSETIVLPRTEEQTEEKEQLKRQPPYHVVLLNDDDHTFEYVIQMMRELFGYPEPRGFQIAEEVHTRGRCVVLTTTKEHAELKQDQIHAYGPDPYSSKDCKGSMTAVIEPAA